MRNERDDNALKTSDMCFIQAQPFGSINKTSNSVSALTGHYTNAPRMTQNTKATVFHSAWVVGGDREQIPTRPEQTRVVAGFGSTSDACKNVRDRLNGGKIPFCPPKWARGFASW